MSLMRYDNYYIQDRVLKAHKYSDIQKLKNVRIKIFIKK
jgi:hypothetical protein